MNRDEPIITASIGVAVYPNDGLDKESLISAADIILYKIKSRGRTVVPSGE
jgi:GGDEF domain-containing protein